MCPKDSQIICYKITSRSSFGLLKCKFSVFILPGQGSFLSIFLKFIFHIIMVIIRSPDVQVKILKIYIQFCKIVDLLFFHNCKVFMSGRISSGYIHMI